MRHYLRASSAAGLALMFGATAAGAQAKTPSDTSSKAAEVERRVEMSRRGGGLRVGQWHVNDQQLPAGTTSSATPSFEGYVRTGLDLHLVLENSIGFWRQRQASNGSGGILGGTSSATADDYVIPQFTSVVLYPMTKPADRLEPFIRGGVGFALGVQDPQSGGGSISFTPGFGATGGVGVEWRASDAFGFALSGRYQWIRFFQDFAGAQTYQGPAIEAGVTYRFQFR
jgi:opacity protein-like surface antigen